MVDEMTVEYLGGYPVVSVEYNPAARMMDDGHNIRFVLHSARFRQNLVGLSWITPELAGDPVALRAYFLSHLQDKEREREQKELLVS